MTRIGWILLVTFLGGAVAFGLMLGGNSSAPTPSRSQAQSLVARQAAATGPLAIPVAGVPRAALGDSWGDSRGGGSRAHKGIDIMAQRGTPVVAAAPGIVEKLFESANGGRTLYLRSGDGGIVFYYAHLDQYRAGIAEGQRVRRGDVIGTVGATGSASDEAPHLHFEIKRMAPGERWHQGEEVNPYPLLAGNTARR